jgi:UDP-3-O-[3-hydroxymyristoyl] glucosamine N-acyltransferase
MQFSAGQIAELLQGEVDGDAQVLVIDVSRIEEGRLGTLTFLANPSTPSTSTPPGPAWPSSRRASGRLKPIPKRLTLIRVADPRAAFAKLLDMHQKHQYEKVGYEQPSYVSPKAVIGNGVYVGAFSYIGDGVVLADG